MAKTKKTDANQKDAESLPQLTDEGLVIARAIAKAAKGGDNQAVFELAKKLATQIDE